MAGKPSGRTQRVPLRDEVELVKRLGFNGLRLHQKIETAFSFLVRPPGLIVWEEMPSCYAFSETSVVPS